MSNPKRSADLNQIAHAIVAEATEGGKDPAAVALGRKGGRKGGPARAAALTPARRSEIAQKAARARWGSTGAGYGVLVTLLLYPGPMTVPEIRADLAADGIDLTAAQIRGSLYRHSRAADPLTESPEPGTWRLTEYGDSFINEWLET